MENSILVPNKSLELGDNFVFAGRILLASNGGFVSGRTDFG